MAVAAVVWFAVARSWSWWRWMSNFLNGILFFLFTFDSGSRLVSLWWAILALSASGVGSRSCSDRFRRISRYNLI